MKALLSKVWARVCVLFHEARTKMTTYVALLVASAGELRDQWSQVTDNLPHWKWLVWCESHAFAILGVLMVWARVRRALADSAPSQS